MTGNLIFANGANRYVRIGSATNYSYDLQTVGDDFQIIEAGVTPRLTIKYPNGFVGIGTTSPLANIHVVGQGTSTSVTPAGTQILSHAGGFDAGSFGASLNFVQQWWSGAPTSLISVGQIVGLKTAGNGNFGGGLAFLVGPSGGGSSTHIEAMRIDGNAGGTVTANASFRAPIFYDSNDTAYYIDPASGSVLGGNVSVLGSRNIGIDTNGGSLTIKGDTGGWATGTYFLGSSGTNRGGFGALGGGDGLSYLWAGNAYNDAALYIYAAGHTVANTSLRAPIFYDSNDTGRYLDPAGTSLLSVLDVSTQLQSYGAFYHRSNYYSLNAAESGWNTIVDRNGGNHIVYGKESVRAPVFYDSDNTAYYVDPNSNSVLNTLYMRNGTVQAKFAQASNFGYSSSYKTVVLGNEYLTTISMGVDVSGNASGSFNGQGEGREVLFRNGVAFITPNAANTAYETPLTLVDGYAASTGSLRAPIFYDSNNTGFYGDFASTSVMADAVIGGRTMSTAMHYAGFTLDANTMPSNSTGFTYGVNAPFVGPIMRAGQPAGGGYDLWLNAPYGGGDRFAFRTRNGDTAALNSWQYPALYNVNVNGGGALYATIYYDQNNTGYYVNPDGTSNIYQLTGAITHGSYGSFSASGSYNGYAGVAFPAVGVTLMANQGASGFYFNDNTWGMYCNSSGSMYSRIFYDLNDTGYYCDPTSGSVFNRLVSITGAGNSSGGNLQLGDKTESTAKWSVMTGAHYNGVSQAKGITLIASYGYATGNDISIGGNIYEANPATYIAFYTATSITHPTGGSNRLSINGDGNVTANVDIRAPIYYDSNNTAFYVDGNNGTRLNALYPNAIQTQSTSIPAPRWDCSFYVLQSQHWYSHNGASTMYVGESGDFVYIRGYTTADGSSRAPIFYDNQNTSYYVDPSSTGTSLNVAGNIDCIARSAAWSEGLRVRVPSRNTWGGIRFTRDEANSNGNWAIGFTGIDSTDDLTFWGNVSGAEGMRARLTQGGNFTATGNVTAYSDARLKQEVETIKNALDLVSQMRGVTYTRKDTGEAGVGVIAQEMREIMPQVVLQDGGDDGTLSVAYGNLVGVLIEAVKELTLKVKTLEEKDN
jgi:hypothetical protein